MPRADLDQALMEWDDPQAVMHRITRGALNLIATADGATIQLLDAAGDLALVCVEGLGPGATAIRLPSRGSLSGLAVTSQTAQRTDDTEHDARVDRASCRQVGARSLVCVPLVHGAGPIGVVSVMSTRPAAFDDEVVDTLSELAGFISVLVATLVRSAGDGVGQPGAVQAVGDGEPSGHRSRASSRESQANRVARFVSELIDPEIASRSEARARVMETLDRRALDIVFQPIVNLARGTTVALEALSRFPGVPARPPNVWFAEAHSVGLGVELELLAIEEALAALRRLPPSMVLAVNASPMTVASRELGHLLSVVEARRVAIEITEHVAVDDYAVLVRRIAGLRQLGARISIDDTGAGYASLRHILALSPEYIKLDLALTRDIDTDPARRALAGALVAFVDENGARLIAEGIETDGELATVRELGIHYGQGYHLGKPAPLDELDLPSALHRIAPTRSRREALSPR